MHPGRLATRGSKIHRGNRQVGLIVLSSLAVNDTIGPRLVDMTHLKVQSVCTFSVNIPVSWPLLINKKMSLLVINYLRGRSLTTLTLMKEFICYYK